MPHYFLCYRRDDTAGHAGRLYGDLVREFDEESVFFDLRSVPAGEDFREVVRSSIAACDVVLVMIGRNWQPKLLHDPADYVRHEIDAALAGGKRIVPVLVQGTPMPEPETLPEPIRQMAYRNASEISDRHWDADVKALVRVLRGRRAGGRRWVWPAVATALLAVIVALLLMPRWRDGEGATTATDTIGTSPDTTTTGPTTFTTTTGTPTVTNTTTTGTPTLTGITKDPRVPTITGIDIRDLPTLTADLRPVGDTLATLTAKSPASLRIILSRANHTRTYSWSLNRVLRERRLPQGLSPPFLGVTDVSLEEGTYELALSVVRPERGAHMEVEVALGDQKDSKRILRPANGETTIYKWRLIVR